MKHSINPFSRHYKRHGHIHAAWIIALLCGLIAAQMLGTIQGEKINDFISFASSLASLILAVVAIFYAMISNQGFSETIGSLKTSANTVESATSRICDVSSDLSQKSEILLSQLEDFKPKLSEFSEKLDVFSSPAADAEIKTLKKSAKGLNQFSGPNGASVGPFILALAFEAKRKFNVTEISKFFEKHNDDWDNWLNGYFVSLVQWPTEGIVLSRDSDENTFFASDVRQDIVQYGLKKGQEYSKMENYDLFVVRVRQYFEGQ